MRTISKVITACIYNCLVWCRLIAPSTTERLTSHTRSSGRGLMQGFDFFCSRSERLERKKKRKKERKEDRKKDRKKERK